MTLHSDKSKKWHPVFNDGVPYEFLSLAQRKEICEEYPLYSVAGYMWIRDADDVDTDQKPQIARWKVIEGHLHSAMAVLPSEKTAQVREYLERNELGLAWETMKELAESHIVGSEAEACFWRPMAIAVGLMMDGHYHECVE